jgi:hypothetical protein
MTVARRVRSVPLIFALLLTTCAAPHAPDANRSAVNPLRVPVEPVLLTDSFSCTAYVEAACPGSGSVWN